MTRPPLPLQVVDDEPEIRAILDDFLSAAGYAVVAAASAEEGAQRLGERRFHALILDLNLPGQDGLALLEQVRGRVPDLCVLIITGYATADSAIEALRLGTDDYLQKPFELDALARALSRALGGRRLKRENRALVARLQRMNRALDRRRQELAGRVAEATRNLRLLLDSARDLNKDLDLDDTLAGVVEQAARLVRARLSLVFLREEGRDRFELEASVAAGGGPPPSDLAFGMGEGIAGRSVLFGRPLTAFGTELDPEDPLRSLGATSLLAVPMLREGVACGVLLLVDRHPDGGSLAAKITEFSGEDEEIALTLAAHAALAIRNAQVYEEARRLDRLQSEFVAAVSHELRTPLTQIKAALEIVDTYYGPTLDIRGRDLLAISEAAVRTLEDQVELILASAEIETDALTLDLALIPAHDVAEEAAGRLLPVAVRRGIRIEVAAPSAAVVEVDRKRFVRALSNLLSNAVKFSDSGQVVRLEVEAQDGQVRFHVIDRGIGIDPRDQAHIFHRFAQLDGSLTRRTGGTGLGLSVSRALVERHGGQILLRSRPGEGSRFTIEIPAAVPGERRDSIAA